jgi:predicted PurR-regulated permease PerM
MVERRAPSWLVSAGVRSWLALGFVLIVVLTYLSIEAAAQLVLPMVIAGVIGALFAPLVEKMVEWRVPKLLATTIVILGLFAIIGATMWVTITSVAQQAGMIEDQVEKGITAITDALDENGVDLSSSSKSDASSSASSAPSDLANKALGSIGSLFSSLGSVLFGAFIASFLLFYALMDWPRFERWLGGRMGVPDHVGRQIVDDAIGDLRLYFGGLTISSIVVSIIIGLTMWALDVPLALTVAVVTFVTAYIPYVGAILSGAFAFIVALGAGGLPIALTVLVVVLVTQNVVQAVLQARITSGGLEVHPAMNFAATILGGIVAGAIGAILAAPLVATGFKARRLLTAYFAEREAAVYASGDEPAGATSP